MALAVDKIGTVTDPFTHAYTWQDQALYALGIGAKKDELAYLYEGVEGGMKVYPTYAVVPAFEAVFSLLDAIGADLTKIVHGGQRVRVHRAIPAQGSLETRATVAGIYDLKRFAQAILTTETTLDGEPLFDTMWSIIVLGGGGFGGARPPKDEIPKVPRDAQPDWVVRETTSPEQALLYRLNGDFNPLHADAGFAAKVGFDQPILHGLCTYGHVARACIASAAEGDAGRLREIAVQFRKPVCPGDTIVTTGYKVAANTYALQASVEGRDEVVVSNAWARLD